jgi:23S rRNA (uracil1939-C5)-methyltransferase
MLTAGKQLELDIEKPAAGGRMIARYEGQVVFVAGAIPGERVLVRIDKADRQLAFGTTVEVRASSPDRRAPFADPLCGGCLYAHVAYPRQLTLKSEVIQDAFRRLGRIEPPPLDVRASPERGYRMRGRLYVQEGRAGFYREGSHSLCDAAATGLLTAAAVEAASSFADGLQSEGAPATSIEVSENLAGDERALHVELQPGGRIEAAALDALARLHRLTGCSVRSDRGVMVAMDPAVGDPLVTLTSGRATEGVLRRRAESFFQANRFLLPDLVSTVLDEIPRDGEILDLYAGVGLFSVSLAATGRRLITAVEGDRSSGLDLRANASQFPGAVQVLLGSVEGFLASGQRSRAETVIVDPPRTGISRAAMSAVASYCASRIVYVSCDPATMARDARRLLDAGYELQSLRGYDLFPNTPHVESVGVFQQRATS